MTAPHAKPRLYYDCPLKAAWMAKYFGMRFERSDGDLLLDWDDMVDDLAICVASDSWAGKYSVHPDSLHLLEPVEGDVILSSNKQHAVLVGKRPFAEQSVEDARANVAEHGFQIIQRDGVAFHWPEREAA